MAFHRVFGQVFTEIIVYARATELHGRGLLKTQSQIMSKIGNAVGSNCLTPYLNSP